MRETAERARLVVALLSIGNVHALADELDPTTFVSTWDRFRQALDEEVARTGGHVVEASAGNVTAAWRSSDAIEALSLAGALLQAATQSVADLGARVLVQGAVTEGECVIASTGRRIVRALGDPLARAYRLRHLLGKGQGVVVDRGERADAVIVGQGDRLVRLVDERSR